MAIPRRTTDDAVGVPSLPALRLEADGKVSARTLEAIRAALVALAAKVNGLLSFGQASSGAWAGNIDGQFVYVKSPSVANAEFPIPHGLGRVPVGYFIVRANSPDILYDNGGGNWTDTTIYLRCTSPGISLRILVF